MRGVTEDDLVDPADELKGIGAHDVGAGQKILVVQGLNCLGMGAQAMVAPAHPAADQFGADATIQDDRLAGR